MPRGHECKRNIGTGKINGSSRTKEVSFGGMEGRIDGRGMEDRIGVGTFVEPEWQANIRRRGDHWTLSGNCLCCAAHGLSCLVTVQAGDQKSTLLFDTGPGDQTFEQNVSRLGRSLSSVQEIVLSHGHWDHSGAMLKALEIIRNGNGGKPVPCHTHPDMYYKRALKTPSGKFIMMEDVPSIEQLEDNGATVVNTKEPQAIVDNLVYISGEIPRVTSFEAGFQNHYR